MLSNLYMYAGLKHFIMPPPPLSKKEGHIALHMSAGQYVGLP